MLSFPNAKINLGLHILERLPSGYHVIESVFYPTNFCDALEILPSEHSIFTTSGLPVPNSGGEPNLCERAFLLLQTDFGLPNVQMHLQKHIPIGAGLGGGSADAAFVLKATNSLFKLQLSNAQLCEYAAKLGSDCPFFIQNTPAYLKGIGKEMQDFSLDLSPYFLVLVYPNIHISTSVAYAKASPKPPEYDLKKALTKPVETWKNTVKNDFESHIFVEYPAIETIKNRLYHSGALYASMSGSGSTVFGIFAALPHLQPNFEGCIYWQGALSNTEL